MNRLEFLVIGSQGDEYQVTFERDGDNLNAYCDCQAGLNGLYCKHRFALMDGDVTRLASDNPDDVARLRFMLAGTDVERAYQRTLKAEKRHRQAIKKLKAAKAVLARAMYQ